MTSVGGLLVRRLLGMTGAAVTGAECVNNNVIDFAGRMAMWWL